MYCVQYSTVQGVTLQLGVEGAVYQRDLDVPAVGGGPRVAHHGEQPDGVQQVDGVHVQVHWGNIITLSS